MRKKKCKKILRSGCFLVACCVILAGAAAPLTAYAAEDDGSAALDVAQETMRLAAGVYRWNDVLTLPQDDSLPWEVFFDFSVSPGYERVDSEVVVSGSYNSLGLVIQFIDSHLTLLYYGDWLVVPYSSEVLWTGTAALAAAAGVTNASVLNGWGQTIRIPYAQEVPVDFGEWFISNTVKQEMPGDNLLESIFSAIRAPLSWVGSVLGALISGPMSELLPLFAVFIAISLILVVVVLVKKSIWGG